MQYAVNVADLTTDTIIAGFLVGPVTRAGNIVRAEPSAADGHALVLDCDDEQAAAIVDVIRMKYPKNLFRCYERGKRGAWRRI